MKAKFVILILSAVFFINLFLRNSMAIMSFELISEFDIDYVVLGFMSSIYFYIYAMLQIPVGLLTDRIGVRYTITFFGLITVIACFLFGRAENVGMLYLSRLIMGLGTAGFWVPILKYLSLKYRKDEFASLSGIISIIGTTGIILATYPLAILIITIGWRNSYYLIGLVTLIIILSSWMLLKNNSFKGEVNKAIDFSLTQAVRMVIINKQFLLLCLWAFTITGTFYTFSSLYGGVFLKDIYELNSETSSYYLLITAIGFAIGGLVWALLSDRYFRARLPVLFICTIGIVITWIGLVLSPRDFNSFYTYFIYFFIGVFSIVMLLAYTCVKELFPSKISGTAFGILNTLMFLGVAFFQSVSSLILNTYSPIYGVYFAYRLSFSFIVCSLIVAILAITFLIETYDCIEPDLYGG